jgi:hypothetical protein
MVYSPDLLIPNGNISSDSQYGVPWSCDKACDDVLATRWSSTDSSFPHWWKYTFSSDYLRVVTKLRIKPFGTGCNCQIKDFKLQGSNNDSDWDDLHTGQCTDDENWQDFIISNTTKYKYYRIYITSSYFTGGNQVSFYETEMLEDVGTCNGDILTGGSATADSYYDDNPTWNPDKGNDDSMLTRWSSKDTSMPHWWKYDLGSGVTKVAIKLRIVTSDGQLKNFILKGSNNDSDWDTLLSDQAGDNENWQDFVFSNSTAYRYYKLIFSDSYFQPTGDQVSFWEAELVECLNGYEGEDELLFPGNFFLVL